ncbi:MAG TPA: FAD-binding oxidoreductase [Candidatus Nanopelagicaceae bacterium]|nr:FAD-binding oxidoreductase [Candidatus Nanopelagicaceae bacterium]
MSSPLSDKYDSCLITERRDLAAELWTIRVRPEAPFTFRPGQYATLGVDLDGKVLERPYSIVSAPEEAELEFFIEMIPGGALTPHLHRLGSGDRLLMRRRPKGLFLRQGLDLNRAHLFLATVTGIAPFASILRQLTLPGRQGTASPRIMLIQGASYSHEFGYQQEMFDLEAELSGFKYLPTVSRPWDDPSWQGETGRAEDVLRKYSDQFGIGPKTGLVYLCGHPGMIATARSVMRRRGLADSEILEEQYWPEGKAPAGAA